MPKLGDSKSYENIFISPVAAVFKRDEVANVPRQFYADWVDLVVKVAKIIYPPFSIPPLPETISFKEDAYEINPITEVYYFISVNEFILKGEGDFSVTIKAYYGYQTWDGSDHIEITLTGIPSSYPEFLGVSSSIKFESNPPYARFHMWADPAQLVEIETLFADQLKRQGENA
ncbi:hypothetical protein GO755_22235 [Spirosoma sp. HMF4905]|uniref:Uncharacterized protein n=1 Tax=Spirosoma arboris TaxID=2682092 RepID=A0A7K1SGR0_9BACT|nr:hypothetical protein [Spirosoma arboris]MVM32776.1 hypothetical protein [Spirosoma arboris]